MWVKHLFILWICIRIRAKVRANNKSLSTPSPFSGFPSGLSKAVPQLHVFIFRIKVGYCKRAKSAFCHLFSTFYVFSYCIGKTLLTPCNILFVASSQTASLPERSGINCREKLLLRSNFSSFPHYFIYIFLTSGVKLHIHKPLYILQQRNSSCQQRVVLLSVFLFSHLCRYSWMFRSWQHCRMNFIFRLYVSVSLGVICGDYTSIKYTRNEIHFL